MNTSAPAHFYVFTVEEFDAPTPEDLARKVKSWTKAGSRIQHSAALTATGRQAGCSPGQWRGGRGVLSVES